MSVNLFRGDEGNQDCPSVEQLEREIDAYLSDGRNCSRLWTHIRAELTDRKIYFGSELLPTFPRAHLISRHVARAWSTLVEEIASLLEHIGRQLLHDPILRGRLGLPPGSDELLEIEPGYSRLGIVARYDMVWSGQQLRILEANVDSPAMMTFSDQLGELFLAADPYESFRSYGIKPGGRTAEMLRALLESYKEWGGVRKDPTIAIVDWANESTANELTHTARVFEDLGCPTVVCDPRDLQLVGKRLQYAGRTIDIVQRRVLFPDFLRRRRDLAPLLAAYRRGLVCMINPLRSFVIGNKATLAYASQYPQEFDLPAVASSIFRSLVPESRIVDSAMARRLLDEKDQWVFKHALGSGGNGVTIGKYTPADQWERVISTAAAEISIAQRLQPIPKFRVPLLSPRPTGAFETLYANWNPWVFAGRYSAAMTRVGRRPIVGITGGGGLLPVFEIPDSNHESTLNL